MQILLEKFCINDPVEQRLVCSVLECLSLAREISKL